MQCKTAKQLDKIYMFRLLLRNSDLQSQVHIKECLGHILLNMLIVINIVILLNKSGF